MNKHNMFLLRVSKILKKLRPLLYAAGFVIVYIGLVDLIDEAFNDNARSWKGVVIALFVMGLRLYWTWFRPVKRYKAIVKRSEKYIRNLNSTSRAIKVLESGLNRDNFSEAQNIDIRMRLGELYLTQGEAECSEQYFNQAFSISRDQRTYSELLLKTVWFYSEVQDYNKASEYLDKAFEAGQPYLSQAKISKDNLFDYIIIYIGADRKDRAREVYNMLIERSVVKPNNKIEKLL